MKKETQWLVYDLSIEGVSLVNKLPVSVQQHSSKIRAIRNS